MARRNAHQRQCRPFRLPAILFPVAQSVHADPERVRELSLRKPDEPTQRRHVSRLKLPANDPLTLTTTEGSGEVRLG
jgi:hypothetical protein